MTAKRRATWNNRLASRKFWYALGLSAALVWRRAYGEAALVFTTYCAANVTEAIKAPEVAE